MVARRSEVEIDSGQLMLAVARLLKETDWTQRRIARQLGLVPSRITRLKCAYEAEHGKIERSPKASFFRERRKGKLTLAQKQRILHLMCEGVSEWGLIAQDVGLPRILVRNYGTGARRVWRRAGFDLRPFSSWPPSRPRKPKVVKVERIASDILARRQDELYRSIWDAMPKGMDPALRDDAVSAAYLAILEDPSSAADLATVVREQVRKAYKEYADRYGARSLFETTGDDSATRLIDLLEDDHPAYVDDCPLDDLFEIEMARAA